MINVRGGGGLGAHPLEEEVTHFYHAGPVSGADFDAVPGAHKRRWLRARAVDSHVSSAARDRRLGPGLRKPDGPHPYIHSHCVNGHPSSLRGATYA